MEEEEEWSLEWRVERRRSDGGQAQDILRTNGQCKAFFTPAGRGRVGTGRNNQEHGRTNSGEVRELDPPRGLNILASLVQGGLTLLPYTSKLLVEGTGGSKNISHSRL